MDSSKQVTTCTAYGRSICSFCFTHDWWEPGLWAQQQHFIKAEMLDRGNQEARERAGQGWINPINLRTSHQPPHQCHGLEQGFQETARIQSVHPRAPCMPFWSWKLSSCCSPLWNGIVLTYAVQEHLITPMLSLNLAASNGNNNNSKTANSGYLSKTWPVQQASHIMICELPVFRTNDLKPTGPNFTLGHQPSSVCHD